MENKIVSRCTICGLKHEVVISQEVVTCQACGNLFLNSDGKLLDSKPLSEIEVLKNLRLRLDDMVRVNDYKMIQEHSKEILFILPDDFVSLYFYAYATYNLYQPKLLREFLSKKQILTTKPHLDKVTNHIIHHVDIKEFKFMYDFIKNNNFEFYDQAKLNIEHRITLEEQYSNINRDVFICHRSTDYDILIELVDALEKDGFSCWFSERNLRPDDNQNYWNNIEKAISNCNIFLMISSQSAMLSRDIQKELLYADQLRKTKIEYKIDNKPHTTLFKQSFDGIKWIDATSNRKLDVLLKRVTQLMIENDFVAKFKKMDKESVYSSNSNKQQSYEVNKDKKIEIKTLKKIQKSSRNIHKLEVINLSEKSEEKNITSSSIEKIILSGYMFLENGLFDIAKTNFLNIYSKNKDNSKLLLGLIYSEIEINPKFSQINSEKLQLKYSPKVDKYFDSLLNTLTSSTESRKIIEEIETLAYVLLALCKIEDQLIGVFTTTLNFLIKLLDFEKVIKIYNILILDLVYINPNLSKNSIDKLYVTFRDLMLNYDKEEFIYLVELLSKISNKGLGFKFKDKIIDALSFYPQNYKLNQILVMNLTRTVSFDEALMKIVRNKKVGIIDEFLSVVDFPDIAITKILNRVQTNEMFLRKISINKIAKFMNHIVDFLTSFSTNLYIEQLNKIGYYFLRYEYFKEAVKVYRRVLKISNYESSLWGIVMANNKCRDELEMFRNKIDFVKVPEYNILLSYTNDIDFYNKLYLSIKKQQLSDDLKQEIINRWKD